MAQKHITYVIQYNWDGYWIDCTDKIFTDKVAALSEITLIRCQPRCPQFRVIKRTEEEIA